MNDSDSGKQPPAVADGREIARLLTQVGSAKLGLPQSIRGVLNTTGLYVQVRPLRFYDGDTRKTEWVLRAGGKFRMPVAAIPYGHKTRMSSFTFRPFLFRR